jgi:hypothetical protein
VVEQQGGSEPLKNAYMMYDTPDSYAKCGDETFPFGSQGCPPDNGSCEGNLQPVERGDRTICDDPNALHPAYAFIDSGDLDVIQGQDVADQFCRSFFCDERFVCAYDNQRRNGTCVVCNESGEFGKGGCGTVFSDAAPTCLYTDWCASDPEDIEVGDVQFGC